MAVLSLFLPRNALFWLGRIVAFLAAVYFLEKKKSQIQMITNELNQYKRNENTKVLEQKSIAEKLKSEFEDKRKKDQNAHDVL